MIPSLTPHAHPGVRPSRIARRPRVPDGSFGVARRLPVGRRPSKARSRATVPGNPASPVLRRHVPVLLDVAGPRRRAATSRRSSTSPASPTATPTAGSQARDRRAVPDAHRRAPAGLAGRDFNGTVLVEWQNVTAGYDLDALWNRDGTCARGTRGSASPRSASASTSCAAGARRATAPSTSRAAAVRHRPALLRHLRPGRAGACASPAGVDPLGGLDVEHVLAIGASQSAGRMTTYYDVVLPQVTPVFDGYAFIVGAAPSRVGPEPMFQVLSETDVTTPVGRRPDSDVFRRWEVAGAAHSGWEGQEYRAPLADPRPRRRAGLQLHQPAVQPRPAEPGRSRPPTATSRAGSPADTLPPPAPYLEFNGRRHEGPRTSSGWRRAASSSRRCACRPR